LKEHRKEVVINTKIGHLPDGSTDWSVDTIEKQIRSSLERLQTDYLDSVILHNPPLEILQGKTGHFIELKRLKALGVIKAYGVSIDTLQELKTTIEKTDSQVVEILFNAFFQEPAALFPFVKAKKIAMIAKVPLDSGWLTGKFNQNSVFTGIRERWDDKTIRRRSIMVEKLKAICQEEDLTATAIAFVLGFDAFTAVIPGICNSQQLDINIQADAKVLSYQTRQKIMDLYNQQIKNDPLPW
jgi:aryl-alcohol dehydrogenase-like predicted oxidoreductase